MESRPEGTTRSDVVTMQLVDADGSTRERKARVLRKHTADKASLLFVFDDPANIRGTALLMIDPEAPGAEDMRWLYLPAMRKTRRVAAGERGDAFVGTELTYEDLRNEAKIRSDEYVAQTLGRSERGSRPCIEVEAKPRDADIARGSGYGRILACVEETSWLPLEYRIFDTNGRAIKVIAMSDARIVGGFWTAFRREVTNLLNGKKTVVVSESVEREIPISDEIFTEDALAHAGR